MDSTFNIESQLGLQHAYPMSTLGFPMDIPITDYIRKNGFTVSAEVIPPRNGADQERVLQQISALSTAKAQFFSVTKGAGGSLRGGSLPISQVIKDRFKVPVIAHFTCRDLTPVEIENQLMDHYYFGIRNILALRGDPPQDGSYDRGNPLSYPFAYQLIEQIRNLNQGIFLKRTDERNSAPLPTRFCIGAAAYPEQKPYQDGIDFLLKKIAMGAHFAITQMVFDIETYLRFCNDIHKSYPGFPILFGTRLLKSQPQALRIAARFGISVPTALLDELPTHETKALSSQSKNAMIRLFLGAKSAGAPGLHLFVLSDTQEICELMKDITPS